MAELNQMEIKYEDVPVVVSQERYQDLLEHEVTVQMIAQARDDLDELDFSMFMRMMFPKVPHNECEG